MSVERLRGGYRGCGVLRIYGSDGASRLYLPDGTDEAHGVMECMEHMEHMKRIAQMEHMEHIE